MKTGQTTEMKTLQEITGNLRLNSQSDRITYMTGSFEHSSIQQSSSKIYGSKAVCILLS